MTTTSPASTIPESRSGAAIVEFARDIKLSHSVFALPFALLSMFMAAEAAMPGRRPTWLQFALVVGCMIVARSFAMGTNRLLDARGDALNPRTARRAIPAGRLSVGAAIAILIGCAIAFEAVTLGFGFAYRNWLPAVLAMPVLALLGAYPLFKRFTRFCHYYLGLCLGLAPICAWVAVAGRFDVLPFVLAGAVMCWTGGFDILYACQDYAHDVAAGVFSIPATIGIRNAFWVARLSHVACVALLVLLGILSLPLATIWYVAVSIVAVIFTIEHAVIRPDDLRRLNLAFFTLNGIVSVCLGTLGIIDVLR